MIADPRPPPEYVTVSQAMAMMGVSRRTVYNWRNKGVIVFVYLPGGTPRIDAASLVPRATKVFDAGGC